MTIESFSIITQRYVDTNILSIITNLSIIYPNTNVYVLCNENFFKKMIELFPMDLNININYLPLINDEITKDKKNFFELPFKLFEKALENHSNTMFLHDNINILKPFDLDFNEKNKIMGVKMLDEDYFDGLLYFIQGKSILHKWKNIILHESNKEYQKLSNVNDASDASQNITLCNCSYNNDFFNIIENVEKDIGKNNINDVYYYDSYDLCDCSNNTRAKKIFNGIYINFLKDKIQKLSHYPETMGYMNKSNLISSHDFFRKLHFSISPTHFKVENNELYFKDELVRSFYIDREIKNERMVTINKNFLNIVYKTNYNIFKLFDLKNNKKLLFKLPSTHNLFHQSMDSSCNLLNLVSIWKNKYNHFVMFHQDKTHNHIQLENMVLYDYKDISKFTNDFYSKKILLGSLDTNIDCKLLQEHDISYQPWIYWPKHTDKVEALIDNSQCTLPNFEERIIHSIFIGKHSETREQLKNIIEDVTLYNNEETQMSYDNYLQNISQSKFGICVKGSQSKSRRLMEYLAVGTVPIIVKNQINTTSFENPLQENIHFLSVDSIEDINHIIQTTTKETWNELSENGKTWYFKNIHSSNSFKNLITKFYS